MDGEKIVIDTFSIKVKAEDKKTAKDFVSKFGKQHEGFSELLKLAFEERTAETKEVYTEKNIEQVFEFSTYQAFADPSDTHPSDTIKRALEFANEAKNKVVVDPVIQPGRVLEFEPELEKKLSVLYRFLKTKGKIPEGATEKQFYEKLIAKLITRHIDNNFDFINKD